MATPFSLNNDVAFDAGGGSHGNLAAKFAQSHGRPFHPLFTGSSTFIGGTLHHRRGLFNAGECAPREKQNYP
jgi:hypothetical protein